MKNKELPDHIEEYKRLDGSRKLIDTSWFGIGTWIWTAECGCDQYYGDAIKKKEYKEWDKSETEYIEGQEYRVAKKIKIKEYVCDFCGKTIAKDKYKKDAMFAAPTDRKCWCNKPNVTTTMRITADGNGQCETCGRIEEREDGKQDEK